MQQFRALRINPILATTNERLLSPNAQLKPNIADRARIYNCRIVTAPKIQELARHPDSAEKLEETLFG
jgi:hypothetical protein